MNGDTKMPSNAYNAGPSFSGVKAFVPSIGAPHRVDLPHGGWYCLGEVRLG